MSGPSVRLNQSKNSTSEAPARLVSVEELSTIVTGALWTVAEVAEYLGVPVATIYAWRSRGACPPAFRVGRYLRFRSEEVAAWLDGRRDGAPEGGRSSR